MESFLKEQLNCSSVGFKSSPIGGWISDAKTYIIDDNKLVFVKKHKGKKAKVMFEGEYAGLQAIYNTNTVKVPRSIKVVPFKDEWVHVMENLEMTSLERFGKELGTKLAQLHLHNTLLKDDKDMGSIHHKSCDTYVDKFGFSTTTCCGLIPMPNDWEPNWIDFYTRHRLQPQVDLIMKEYGDREVSELWSQLQLKVPLFFQEVPSIYPSLLHGDLCYGNTGETIHEPVIFDPAALYGHHEFDLSISIMFGGFNQEFYSTYHSLIPKSPGFESRLKLYQLFHHFNLWNHFGSDYRHQSISMMKELITTY